MVSTLLKDECRSLNIAPGYSSIGALCRRVYDDFKLLCAEGKQPGTFSSYFKSFGITAKEMERFRYSNNIKISELPGYSRFGTSGTLQVKDMAFEEVIFEESGFFPAASNDVITVKVDGYAEVCFPGNTDVAVLVDFVKKMGREVCHVGA